MDLTKNENSYQLNIKKETTIIKKYQTNLKRLDTTSMHVTSHMSEKTI